MNKKGKEDWQYSWSCIHERQRCKSFIVQEGVGQIFKKISQVMLWTEKLNPEESDDLMTSTKTPDIVSRTAFKKTLAQ